MMLLFEKAKECPSCWERTQFFSEPVMCAAHKEAEYDPAWTAADRHMIVPICTWHGCTSTLITFTGPNVPSLCQPHSELWRESPEPPRLKQIYSASCEDVEPGFLEQAVRDLVPESFRDIDARLAAMYGYSPIQDRLEAIDTRTTRIEAAVDRIERGLIRHGTL